MKRWSPTKEFCHGVPSSHPSLGLHVLFLFRTIHSTGKALEKNFITCTTLWYLVAWAHLWWCSALCAAPPAVRRSGGRHSRGALRPLRRPLSPPAAAFNSPSGAGWTPARSAIPAAQGHKPWASCWRQPPQAMTQGRRACAGDGPRQEPLKGSLPPHHRAPRCCRSAA